jgi:hypothetical protein
MKTIMVGGELVGVPDDATPEVMDRIATAHAQGKQQASAKQAYEGTNPLTKFAVGVGSAAAEPVLGLAQLATKGAERLGVPGAATATRDIEDRVASVRGAREGAGGWGTGGEIASWLAPGTAGAKVVGKLASKGPQMVQGATRLAGAMGMGAAEMGGYEASRASLAGDPLRRDRAKEGAIAGGAGAGIGKAGGKLVGSIVGGVRANPAAAKLISEAEQAGGRLRLSAGQALGGVANTLEEKFAALPFAGGMVSGKRDRAMLDWADAQLRKAIGGIDPATASQKPPVSVGDVLDSVGAAYDNAVQGVTVRLNPLVNPFGNRNTRALVNAIADPREAEIAQNVISGALTQLRSGKLAGEQITALRSQLKKQASEQYRKGAYALGDALDSVADDFMNVARNSMGPAKAAIYDAANKAYQRVKPITKAASMKGALVNEIPFTPTQLVTGEMRGAAASRNARGGSPQMQEAIAAEKVVGSKLPGKSPTAEKLLAVGIPVGAGAAIGAINQGEFPWGPAATAGLEGLALGSSFLGPRGARSRAIGEALRSKAGPRIGRAVASGFTQDQE